MDDEVMIEVTLEGGPTDLPRSMRVPIDRIRDRILKIPRRNGYEHFVCDSAEVRITAPAIFYWTTRTRIAE